MEKLSTNLLLLGATIAIGLAFLIPELAGLLLVGFIPLFHGFKEQLNRPVGVFRRLLLLVFLHTFCWQLIAGSWMMNFGWLKVVGIVSINALLLTAFFLPAYFFWHSKWSSRSKLIGLIGQYVFAFSSLELLHQYWELSFPVIGLGAAFTALSEWVQWYAITGAQAGTLVVLLVNALAYSWIQSFPIAKGGIQFGSSQTRRLFFNRGLALLLLLGLMRSGLPGGEQNLKFDAPLEILALHPNLDCRSTRQELSQDEMIAYYANLIEEGLSDETDLVLLPETSMLNLAWNEDLKNGFATGLTEEIQGLLQTYLPFTILSGAVTNSLARPIEMEDHALQYAPQIDRHFFAHNAVVAISPDRLELVRTKEKLVPFEEAIPYPGGLGALQNLIGKVSITDFFFKTDHRTNQVLQLGENRILPLVCYESTYSDFVAELVDRHRPTVLTVHLNEGWYDNQFGAQLMQRHARARAIETGRFVARSSNRGISDIISPDGAIFQAEVEQVASSVRAQVFGQSQKTAFVAFWSKFISPCLALTYLAYCCLGVLAFFWKPSVKTIPAANPPSASI